MFTPVLISFFIKDQGGLAQNTGFSKFIEHTIFIFVILWSCARLIIVKLHLFAVETFYCNNFRVAEINSARIVGFGLSIFLFEILTDWRLILCIFCLAAFLLSIDVCSRIFVAFKQISTTRKKKIIVHHQMPVSI